MEKLANGGENWCSLTTHSFVSSAHKRGAKEQGVYWHESLSAARQGSFILKGKAKAVPLSIQHMWTLTINQMVARVCESAPLALFWLAGSSGSYNFMVKGIKYLLS